MHKILLIQTAFIGDVVLATALVESLHEKYPQAKIDIIVRQGNELLFSEHPFLNEIIIWNKKRFKYIHWLKIALKIRAKKYDLLINVQRFAATGLWTVFSKATTTIGFDKNPFSFFFTHKVKHEVTAQGIHEIQRNHLLTQCLGDLKYCLPKLYPTTKALEQVKKYQEEKYITIAPASVWFTKQFPVIAWVKFLEKLHFEGAIYILGAPQDKNIGDSIIAALQKTKEASGVAINKISNLSGQIDFLAAAALQQKAILNYVNDSAPLHFCSAVNAPVVAVYCSTLPSFGFGPLSTHSFIVETKEKLSCRPCGLHGKKQCPLGHFQCAHSIENDQLLAPLLQMSQH